MLPMVECRWMLEIGIDRSGWEQLSAEDRSLVFGVCCEHLDLEPVSWLRSVSSPKLLTSEAVAVPRSSRLTTGVPSEFLELTLSDSSFA